MVVHWTTTGLPEVVSIPLDTILALECAWPNPVPLAGSQLAFALQNGGEVDLALFDPAGRRVLNLARGPYAAGWHEVRLSAPGLAGGTYFAVLKLGGTAIAKEKLTLLGR